MFVILKVQIDFELIPSSKKLTKSILLSNDNQVYNFYTKGVNMTIRNSF